MNYLKKAELELLINCTIGKDPIKVEVAIQKSIKFLNKVEQDYNATYSSFDISKAVILKCLNNDIIPLPQKKYLDEFEGLDQKKFETTVKNAVNSAFDLKWFSGYSQSDLTEFS
jgi:hypothetical protein